MQSMYSHIIGIDKTNFIHVNTQLPASKHVKTQRSNSPSWMHTLMRRTTPHLALARNSLSSGVTTSARNMATQQWLPPARGCSRGINEGKNKKKQKINQEDWRSENIQSSQDKPRSRKLISTSSDKKELSEVLLWVLSCWVCVRVSGDIAQPNRTVSCSHREGTWSPLPILAPTGWLLMPVTWAMKSPHHHGRTVKTVTHTPKNQHLSQQQFKADILTHWPPLQWPGRSDHSLSWVILSVFTGQVLSDCNVNGVDWEMAIVWARYFVDISDLDIQCKLWATNASKCYLEFQKNYHRRNLNHIFLICKKM